MECDQLEKGRRTFFQSLIIKSIKLKRVTMSYSFFVPGILYGLETAQ